MKPNAIRRNRATQRASRRNVAATAPQKPLQIRNVLVPIDFSKPSLEAIEFALPLLKSFGANLHLVHVVPPDYPMASLAGLPLVVPEVEIGRRVRGHLEDVAAQYSVKLGRQNIHALRGRPYEEICRLARDLKTDLIITSTRGETGLKHVLLGSTAERIVRYSPCPVLVARPEASRSKNGKRPSPSFGKILVPIDFSGCSAQGLAFAMKLARRFESKLVLLHSVHLQYYVASDEYARYDFPQLLEYTTKAAREQMSDLVRNTNWNGLKVDTLVEIGHPGQDICVRAADLGVDLIVTSTHGKTGLKHVLVGSTAEYVVQHAPCSVLVVPAPGRAAIAAPKTS